MYEKYWELKEKPFDITPDPKYFCRSAGHEEALMRFHYVISEHKGAGLLTGEYGSGKTLLVRYVIRELMGQSSKFKVALIVNPVLTATDFLREIIYQLEGNVDYQAKKLQLLHRLNEILYKSVEDQKEVVLIVDEAQAITSKKVFEDLRMMLNFQMNDRFLMTLLLVGQPELKDKIAKLPQFRQRMAITYHLKALREEDVVKYIEHRCTVAGAKNKLFTEGAIDLIAEKSGGIPRRINTYCELALMQGMFDKKNIVDEEIASKATEDVDI